MKLAATFLVALAAFGNERVRNELVSAVEHKLEPAQTVKLSGSPSVVVYLDDAALDINGARVTTKRGDAVFLDPGERSVTNLGSRPARFVRIEFLGSGGAETWGGDGLAPNYTLLVENRYARVYNIRIAAHTNEPQHRHHDRVVVCLSGATLRHKMPDGREEPSTLETDQTVWRRGGTHIGQNLDSTDLWAIAIEPK